ncbi:helix-turn-helix domain-containing protein [Nocardioides sp.]|uniref:PucR family transcriptional regulator n=1 Tax=Nocardioides sp. TaxID=35761 RepID=UPI00263A2BF9|nr:helix-turn-helix domain-containing protein [Nocardioides sp.]
MTSDHRAVEPTVYGAGATSSEPTPHEMLREALSHIAEPIVNQVREFVPAFSGPDRGKRHQLMNTAATAAFHAYIADPSVRDSELRKVDELFRRLGWGEAQSGDTAANIEFALTLGSAATARYLASYGRTHDLPQGPVSDVIAGIFDFTEHLRRELMVGYELGLRNPDRSQRRLWNLLLKREPDATGAVNLHDPLDLEVVHKRAALAGWTVPETVVALALDPTAQATEIARRTDLLSTTQDGWQLILAPATEVGALLAGLNEEGPHGIRAIVSWPIEVAQAHSAVGWVQLSAGLLARGVIAADPVIWCTNHAAEIWLHTDPPLRTLLCQNLLEPLLGETLNSRAILSETLLTWLETRDSAPTIAARMEVHPQTIRYRWRRINELFGANMQDPQFVMQLTMVLKASVPLWRSGELSDFERYKATHAAPAVPPVDDPRLG